MWPYAIQRESLASGHLLGRAGSNSRTDLTPTPPKKYSTCSSPGNFHASLLFEGNLIATPLFVPCSSPLAFGRAAGGAAVMPPFPFSLSRSFPLVPLPEAASGSSTACPPRFMVTFLSRRGTTSICARGGNRGWATAMYADRSKQEQLGGGRYMLVNTNRGRGGIATRGAPKCDRHCCCISALSNRLALALIQKTHDAWFNAKCSKSQLCAPWSFPFAFRSRTKQTGLRAPFRTRRGVVDGI